MTDERWPRVKAVFQAAAARPRGERHAFLAAATGDDEALRREVESLLTWDAADGSTLDGLPPISMDHTPSHPVLAAGRRLGPYEIVAALGAGGMGEVYRARDTRLKRDVAIKVLPSRSLTIPSASRDSSGRHRSWPPSIIRTSAPFTASKNLAVSVRWCWSWSKAKTSRSGSRVGPIPIDEALPIARQIAEALEAAHKKGIIHRDLKPANIKSAPTARSKVLDFGLAKTMEPLSSADERPSPTRRPSCPAALSSAGLILGTAAYMSPEQARGKPLDRRTDIWSFGCVLYEMLTGRATFARETISDTLAAILERDPNRTLLPSATPIPIRRLLRRCLEKDPKDAGSIRRPAPDWRSTMRLRRRPAETLASGASIAVLAFTDMSAAKDQDWFCDGIAEEILNALAPLEGLRVAARTSAFSFKGKGDDLRTIGEKLNVTTVLEGSVRRAGDRVRITVQLSEVANGFQLWSERYDREVKDIFDVQDEIAKAIAERLRVTLAGGKADRLVEQATTNIEAYQLYLKGRALVDRRGAGVPTALDLLRKAVELDPGYSLAWAGVADALTVLVYSGAGRGSESKPQAIAAAETVDQLDPASAAGHTALACATCWTRTTARWRSRSSSEHWSSVRVTGWAAAGTRSSISNGAAGSSSGASQKPAARSTAIRCPRTSR